MGDNGTEGLCLKRIVHHFWSLGGTSLSKGWNLIERFSEDIDLTIDHTFFTNDITNNNQLKNLRKKCHKYVIDNLTKQLATALTRMGLQGFDVVSKTVDEEGFVKTAIL